VVLFGVTVGCGGKACRSGVASASASLGFVVGYLVTGTGWGGVAVGTSWSVANTGFHPTRLAPRGSAEKRAVGDDLGSRLYLASAARVKPRR